MESIIAQNYGRISLQLDFLEELRQSDNRNTKGESIGKS